MNLVEEFRCHRRPVSGQDLAKALSISIRTLYRDIESLRALGAGIDGEPGVGFMMRSGFLLPPIMFTVEEVDALVLGSLWVADKADKPMAEAARKAMARLTAVMPTELTDRVEAKYLSVTPSSHSQRETIDMSAIRRAIHAERKVLIGYNDAAGNSSERVIWPFFLSYLDGARLISAWCELREEIRHFRTDRMSNLTELPARYPKRRHDLIKDWRELESSEGPHK
ncbi:YafY family protein [Sulfitobacter sp. F26169L]|uniref:helix-turn-helix transcriptional regulator n=1 Tax=Sulfitobacter sp. F26169L TaxID=2996015 RepID=UPI002260B92B|nr:YafY family protein [Sulfitobacter sp. F26169L]MCX7565835.1 YafY family protein [Sulfitobacter sp. F26169L]